MQPCTAAARPRSQAPSSLGSTEVRLVPFYFAAAGFATVAPDYLGLGVSPLPHPYLQGSSEASATLDLLAPAAHLAARDGLLVNHDVLVSGFSQGGQAAMAIGHALQQQSGPWRLAALAPIAGPYDLAGTELPAALDPLRVDQSTVTADLAFLVTSWKAWYGLYRDPHEVFTPAYAGRVEGLFDGRHDLAQIAASLPADPAALFQPQLLQWFAHPTGQLATAL